MSEILITTKIKSFSTAVCERIRYYVYILKDPRTSSIFYVGKGLGNRVFMHVANALEAELSNDKLNLIRDIHKLGLEVEHYILRHGLTEEQALEIESACIDILGIENTTNIVKGHYSWERGIKTADEIAQFYDARVIQIVEPTIIISVNRLYKRFMKPIDLYNITRSAWKVSKHRRDQTQYAIAAFQGLVREVYKISSWNINSYGDRWEFVGEIAEQEIRDKYINQSLFNYIKKGARNPIKYTY